MTNPLRLSIYNFRIEVKNANFQGLSFRAVNPLVERYKHKK